MQGMQSEESRFYWIFFFLGSFVFYTDHYSHRVMRRDFALHFADPFYFVKGLNCDENLLLFFGSDPVCKRVSS